MMIQLIRKHKSLTGNVALVLFTAFVFSIAFSLAVAAPVQAGVSPTVTVDGEVVGSTHTTAPYTSGMDPIEVKITPVTYEEFAEMKVAIKEGNTVVSVVYLNQPPSSVSGAVYEGGATNTRANLNWTYTPGSETIELIILPKSGNLTFTIQGNLITTYLALEVPPPETPPSSGGGGGAPPPPAEEPSTTVPGGTLVETDDSATLEVDAEAAQTALAKDGKLTFTIADDVTAPMKSFLLPMEVTNALADKAEAFAELQISGVSIVMPSMFFQGGELATAPDGASLRIDTKPTQVSGIQQDRVVLSDVIEIKFYLVHADGTEKRLAGFEAPVTLVMTYEAGDVPSNLVGIYRSEDGVTWEYVGGQADPIEGTVTVAITKNSYFAVKAWFKSFQDTDGHWAQADIEQMAARHIVQGVDEVNFAPNREITRAEFAAILVRALGIEQSSVTASRFTDVAAAAWYNEVIEAAAEVGLVTGYTDGTFRPNANITRQEMAVMIVRALEHAGQEISMSQAQIAQIMGMFRDGDTIAPWAQTQTAVAVQHGIVKGRTVDTFVPQANATRAEAVTMIKRMLEKTDAQ